MRQPLGHENSGGNGTSLITALGRKRRQKGNKVGRRIPFDQHTVAVSSAQARPAAVMHAPTARPQGEVPSVSPAAAGVKCTRLGRAASLGHPSRCLFPVAEYSRDRGTLDTLWIGYLAASAILRHQGDRPSRMTPLPIPMRFRCMNRPSGSALAARGPVLNTSSTPWGRLRLTHELLRMASPSHPAPREPTEHPTTMARQVSGALSPDQFRCLLPRQKSPLISPCFPLKLEQASLRWGMGKGRGGNRCRWKSRRQRLARIGVGTVHRRAQGIPGSSCESVDGSLPVGEQVERGRTNRERQGFDGGRPASHHTVGARASDTPLLVPPDNHPEEAGVETESSASGGVGGEVRMRPRPTDLQRSGGEIFSEHACTSCVEPTKIFTLGRMCRFARRRQVNWV